MVQDGADDKTVEHIKRILKESNINLYAHLIHRKSKKPILLYAPLIDKDEEDDYRFINGYLLKANELADRKNCEEIIIIVDEEVSKLIIDEYKNKFEIITFTDGDNVMDMTRNIVKKYEDKFKYISQTPVVGGIPLPEMELTLGGFYRILEV